MRKTPQEATKMPMSTGVGWNMPQSPGRKVRWRLVTMMTKRSNHMPIVTKNDTIKTTSGLRRQNLNQNTCGLMTLHEIIVQ